MPITLVEPRVSLTRNPLSGNPAGIHLSPDYAEELLHAVEDLTQARADRSLSGEEDAVRRLQGLATEIAVLAEREVA